MNKLKIIFLREFKTRIKSKKFIIATLLTPLLFGLLILVSILINVYSKEKPRTINVFDPYEITGKKLVSDHLHTIQYIDTGLELSKENFQSQSVDILLLLKDSSQLYSNNPMYTFLSKEKIGLNTIESIENKLEKAISKCRAEKLDLDKNLLSKLDVRVKLENEAFLDQSIDTKNKSGKINIIIGTVCGGIMGFMMYMVIFIYGGMIMRSVMEEKTNRIVELMVSSVKPMKLMLGKLLGVGAVALTQLLIWIILIPIILVVINLFFGVDINSTYETMNAGQNMPLDQIDNLDPQQILLALQSMNWTYIISIFILFFLGGFFIYSSMFAGLGSAIGNDMGESQSLMMPIFVPVIIAFILLMPTLENPNGNLAIISSIFPLFSPILMPARLAFDPPIWQILLSIVLLVLTILLIIWMSGRIYRIGILSYGKKPSYKELIKWFFSKV